MKKNDMSKKSADSQSISDNSDILKTQEANAEALEEQIDDLVKNHPLHNISGEKSSLRDFIAEKMAEDEREEPD